MNRAITAAAALWVLTTTVGCTSLVSSTSGATNEPGRPSNDRARACLDVPEDLQGACPLERGRVLAVRAVREPVSPKGRDFLVGARLYVPASAGTTAGWLGHRMECYRARRAELSAAPPAVCPLVDGPLTVRVDETNNGFAVTIKSDDLESARSILRTSEIFAN